MNVRNGLLAGAAGTAILNAVTYADITLRGRPPSVVPKKMALRIAKAAGIDELDDDRQTALGALLGYADGFGSGMLLAAVRPHLRGVPQFWIGCGLAAMTLVLSEGSATAAGETNPKEWGLSGWLSDIVPRLLYGWIACVTYDALQPAARGPAQ